MKQIRSPEQRLKLEWWSATYKQGKTVLNCCPVGSVCFSHENKEFRHKNKEFSQSLTLHTKMFPLKHNAP